jgi:DNA-binding winged helix-turn-helix (wHTH) protein
MPSSSLWNFGPFRLDAARGCLWRGEHLLPLPPKPLAVLAHLVTNAGEVVTKEALLEAVLKTCMGQIRQVLGETAKHPQYIATVHRRGYRFMAPVTQAATAPEPPSPLAVPFSSSARFVARESEITELCQRLSGLQKPLTRRI